ncbi:hypothetical protein LPB86_18745 [Pedobacter sp. MC2016-14]|uniref:hypothetical protein n=1 Tax=Pedobacter sp. MC2016-14 TaxID=2897327 RepID=UPI001E3CE67C|nr:hypothetical protein [Pedobacter sp. MC2016-14]MCD0490287.1 hypothetical protein [Pedobacter sp. MC2016-14]
MMKNLFILIVLFCSPYLATAQMPEIESYKIAYLTQKLELSTEEARIFWPIYNGFQKEQSALRDERRQKMISFRKITEIDELSDIEIQTLIANELSFKQRDLNLERKYYAQLKANLPIKIIGKYYRAQETFKKELLNRYRRQPN